MIAALSESLVDEMVGALGLPKNVFWHRLFWHTFHGITNRLATLGITFDSLVGKEGLSIGSDWALTNFCNPIPVRGAQFIPLTGPLLVTANHPGAYDSLVIFSKLLRRDICWIGTEIPFLNKLKNVRNHILFTSRTDQHNRMAVARAAIRHLQKGGTLVYFGAGHRDPDPAVYPDAGKMMDTWLLGIDIFFKYVPGLRVLPTVVSGVVSQKWAHHPVTILRRKQIDKQRLSEFGQVITQLLFPRKFMFTPAISFGPPATEVVLRNETRASSVLPAIIAREKFLLVEHCRDFGGDPGL